MYDVKFVRALACILELCRESRLVRVADRSFSLEYESNKENNNKPVKFPKEATAHIVLYEGLVHMIPHVVDSEDFLKLFCRSIQKLDLDDAEMTLIDGSMTTINGIDDADKKADEELTKLLKKLAFLKKTVEKEKEEEDDGVAPLPLKTPAPKRRGRALKAVKCDFTLLMTPEGSSSPVLKREMSTRTRLPRTAKKTCTYNE